MNQIFFRCLRENEIHLIKEIDRSEEIFEVYKLHDNKLILVPSYELVTGFTDSEINQVLSRQYRIVEDDGKIIGAFHDELLVGVGSIENKKRGTPPAYCKMDILYVSNRYRNMNIGKTITDACRMEAKRIGAQHLYISATPSKNTIDFYLKLGAILAAKVDQELFALEPDDIHLELTV